jgi:preprotein translocase, yajC subunit
MEIFQWIIIYIVIIAVFLGPTYLSNRKKKKQQKAMLEALKVGDKIVTIGGITGTVAAVLTDTVEIKIDKNVKMTIMKNAISSVSK